MRRENWSKCNEESADIAEYNRGLRLTISLKNRLEELKKEFEALLKVDNDQQVNMLRSTYKAAEAH